MTFSSKHHVGVCLIAPLTWLASNLSKRTCECIPRIFSKFLAGQLCSHDDCLFPSESVWIWETTSLLYSSFSLDILPNSNPEPCVYKFFVFSRELCYTVFKCSKCRAYLNELLRMSLMVACSLKQFLRDDDSRCELSSAVMNRIFVRSRLIQC